MRSWTSMLGFLLALSSTPAVAIGDAPSTIYSGGTIITMDGETPHMVEAVVVRDGKISFTGTATEAKNRAGPDTQFHDLHGATMLPGFIDAHSHFALAMQAASGLDLNDPALPPVTDIASLTNALRTYVAAHAIPAGQWVVAWQYNQDALVEHRHITRDEIDAVLPAHKVLLLHVSLHGLVANSAALNAAGIDDKSPVPTGGIMPHDDDGRLTGLLFEKATYLMLSNMPQPTEAQKLAALESTQQHYFREGFTHAQEGAGDTGFLTSDAARAKLKIDLAILPFYTGLDALLADPAIKFGEYQDHVKLQGVKFVIDGSPQARTAFSTHEYALGSPEGVHPWYGQPTMDEAMFRAKAKQVFDRGWQIFVHANGDAAIDMAIHTFDALGIKAADDRRPIVVHSQFMRPDQIPAYVRIGVGPALFTNHTYFWGDTHLTNFSEEVVHYISPMRAAKDAGLNISNQSDHPVTPLDTRFQLWTSMARISKAGVVIGADQRLDAYSALQALTTGPAWQIFEENRKGRIKTGLLADFVILDKNPLTTPVDGIRGIKVLETVKEGESVWKRGT